MAIIHNAKNIICVWLNLMLVVGFAFTESCDRTSTCSCECENGVLDFKELASKSGAKYLDQLGTDGVKYSYNPCEPFTETSEGVAIDNCQNVAACQVIEINGIVQYYDTGTQDSVTFSTAKATDVGLQEDLPDVVIAKYVAGDQGRQTEVGLVCNQEDDQTAFVAIGELPQPGTATYRFLIVSPACCLIPVGGLSVGTILIIIFISCSSLYLLVGILFKKVVSKEKGVQLIPNIELWVSVPGLIRDGVLFVARRGHYSKI